MRMVVADVDEHCQHMPTVCRLLRKHRQVSGVISAEKVRAINAARGWVPETELRTWVRSEHALQGSTLEESSFIKSECHACGAVSSQVRRPDEVG